MLPSSFFSLFIPVDGHLRRNEEKKQTNKQKKTEKSDGDVDGCDNEKKSESKKSPHVDSDT